MNGRTYWIEGGVGLDVEDYQDMLVARDHLSLPFLRGRLCPATAIAIRKYQEAHHLALTGVFDEGTILSLSGTVPSIMTRCISAAFWSMQSGIHDAWIDPALGLRWGLGGLSSRNPRQRVALKSIAVDPPKHLGHVMELPGPCQVAFWTLLHTPPRLDWLSIASHRSPPLCRKIQIEAAAALFEGLETELEEVALRRYLRRIRLDSGAYDETDPDWRVGSAASALVEIEAGEALLKQGLVQAWTKNRTIPFRKLGFG